MIRPVLVILVGLALTSSAFAGPRKVLVLPLDGDAAPEIRAKYSASVQRLARTIEGKVTPGDVAFTDTATAIGCDPKQPKCAEDVRATLGVDELIYGTVTKQDDKVVVVVRRVAKDKEPREVSATLETADDPERAEPEFLPLFREKPGDPADGDVVLVNDDPDGNKEDKGDKGEPPPRTPLRRDQVLGYAAIGGGGTLLLISFALWSSASGLKDDIESHPVEDHDDFLRLEEIEGRASTRAWTGNALFLAGLAVGGLGGYLLYRDRKAQHAVVAPAPIPNGAALMLGGVF
jgi:hypothetical protein